MRYMIDTYGNVDLGTLDWNKEGLNFTTISIPNNIKKPKDDNTIANIYCNLYRAVPLNASFVEGDMAVGALGYLYIRDTRYTTTAEFKEAMRGQILRYELETPANGGYLPMYKGRYKVSNVCQLLDKSKYPATQTINGVTFTNNGDGSITANGTATKTTYLRFGENIPYPKNHITLIIGCPIGGTGNTYYSQTSFGNDYGKGLIKKQDRDISSGNCYITVNANTVCNNLVFKPQLFDLTEMYGAGNEPTTVEEFREKFPNDLYPYSPYCWAKMKQMRYVTTTKNLFDISKVPTISGRLIVKDNSICSYSYPVVIDDPNLLSIFKSLKPNTNYTMSATTLNYLGASTNYIVLTFSNANDYNIFYNYSAGFNKVTFSLTQEQINNITHVYFYGRDESSGGPAMWSNIQLEEGSTATPYVPYGYLSLK